MSATEVARLRWRSRRGTRELDAVLGWWLDHRYPGAPRELQLGFADLLEQQDPELWDWITGVGVPERAEWQQIVAQIRARHAE
jgi:antitoxin CptB